ncbi:hypothetical protein LY90DRAFT_668060 [Neocallimastix californiae]|uniref:Zw10-domain-containing protein n=1 Tax=Neocallimastix californiae TaxID=1754190 RepID=A0A1Y2E1D4_9FUNG|nr:hypothetical protein LY90DRAFT_668060 [Neocallimastix californiae]|eukprot:ORY64675.1 hypothetical protein LY90DRAFT_668060 [Neocallimastix californiae]
MLSTNVKWIDHISYIEDNIEKNRVNIIYKKFISTNSFPINLIDKLNALKKELNSLLENNEENNINNHFKINSIKNSLDNLILIAKFHKNIKDFENCFEIGDVIDAAKILNDMSEIKENLNGKLILKADKTINNILIKDEYIVERSQLKNLISQLLSVAFIFNKKNKLPELIITFNLISSQTKKYFDNPVKVKDIFEVLEIIDVVDEDVPILVNHILEKFIKSIVENPKQELSYTNNESHAIITFQKPTLKNNNEELSSLAKLYLMVEKVIKFLELLKKSVYVENDNKCRGFIKIVQKYIWPKVWCILKKDFESIIPDNFDDLKKFSEINEKLLSYENQLFDLEIIPSTSNDISNFLKNIKYHYFKKNKNEFLQMVRDVLQNNDQNTVEVKDELERGGFNMFGDKKIKFNIKENKEKSEMDDNSFKLPTCHISVQTQTIVEIAYQKMNEAVESDELNAIEAFYNVRDLFVLFRAITPIYHQDSIEFIPSRAMLFYNDCVYIAHHLLTLGHHYQNKLRPPLDSTATFIDMVPAYRRLGQMYFKKQLRRQRNKLLNNLKQINGFENLSDDNKLENTESIFRNIIYQLDNLSKDWKIILANEVYLQVIGLLFNSLLEDILNEVLNIKSISNNEIHQLKYLLSLLVIHSKEWFTFTIGSGKEKITKQAPILKYVELWEKFQQLFNVLEISIHQILERGWSKFNKFTKQELLIIFNARFRDLSEYKRLKELLE